jgi:hypothetical protein
MEYPVLPADIKKINRQLESHFGINTEDMRPMWRVSWSDDQYEKRMTDRTDAGIILLHPEVRGLPKYQWVRARWLLERLIAVPPQQVEELAGAKTSYECVWAFSSKDTSRPITPSFTACKFVIDLIYAAQEGNGGMAKYLDPDTTKESHEKRIREIELELFGDESSLLGKTFKGEGIVVPNSYEPTQKVE